MNKDQNPKEQFEHKTKTPRRKIKIRIGTVGYEICHIEERKNMENEEEWERELWAERDS
jgi:hypothetical protein